MSEAEYREALCRLEIRNVPPPVQAAYDAALTRPCQRTWDALKLALLRNPPGPQQAYVEPVAQPQGVDSTALSTSVLQHQARALASSLLEQLIQARLLESIWSSYDEACKGPLARFGVQARLMEAEDRERLRFEVCCFAAYILMGQEVPKMLGRDQPRIKFFNTIFGEALVTRLSASDGRCKIVLASPTPSLQDDDRPTLELGRRIADYLGLGTPESVTAFFGAKITDVLDAHQPILTVITVSYIEPIVVLARSALDKTFAKS